MKKFKFDTWIVETRKMSSSYLLLTAGAIAALGYNLYNYLQFNKIDFIEGIIDLFNLFGSSGLVYQVTFIALFALAIPGLYHIFRKKTVKKGYLNFNEEQLTIVDGNERYEIPEAKLKKMSFELKKLPEEKPEKINPKSKGKTKPKPKELQGGNYMILPMDDGNHRYEINLDSKEDRLELLNMVEFLKIQHDIKVKIKEIK